MEYCVNTPNFRKMHELVCSSHKAPYGILNTAKSMWAETSSNYWYGNSYAAADPKSWALQQLGLSVTSALSNHIDESY